MLQAAESYLKDDSMEARKQGLSVTLHALREQIAFGRDPQRDDKDVIHLRALISQLQRLGLDNDIADEVLYHA